jgi:aromatic ring hydroxylase
MSRPWRAVALAVALAVAGAGCSGGSNPASSKFCVQARQAADLDRRIQATPSSSSDALRTSWSDYLNKVNEAAGSAPSSLRGDYATYAGWLATFAAALERTGYSYADALTDPEFMRATDNEAVGKARGAVDTYVNTSCRETKSS